MRRNTGKGSSRPWADQEPLEGGTAELCLSARKRTEPATRDLYEGLGERPATARRPSLTAARSASALLKRSCGLT